MLGASHFLYLSTIWSDIFTYFHIIAADIQHAELRKLPENDRIILSTAVFHKADIFVAGNEKDFKTSVTKEFSALSY
jgi:hypothetical protein